MTLLDAALGPLQLNGTLLVEFIAFLVMLGILARWVYPPVMRAAEGRQKQIGEQLAAADRARAQAEDRLLQADASVQEARVQAGQIIERSNRAGERIQQEAQERAREEARRIVDSASRDIEAEREQATQAIRRQLADIVSAAVAKIVGESLNGDRHRKLIDAAIDEVEKAPSATQ